jgi:hypothetical protein
MDMTGSNLVLQAAMGQESEGDPKRNSSSDQTADSSSFHAMNDADHRSRQATSYRFAAVTVLVVAFLGILFAVAALTDSPDKETAAVQPMPMAAPTAVLDPGNQRLSD